MAKVWPQMHGHSQQFLFLVSWLCLIVFNEDSKSLYHPKTRETPLRSWYNGSLSNTKNLVDKLFQLGLSVSYDRVSAISAILANGLNKQYNEHGVVCPPAFRKSLDTRATVDNIDHNHSATTSRDASHVTDISLLQFKNSQATRESHVSHPLMVHDVNQRLSNHCQNHIQMFLL